MNGKIKGIIVCGVVVACLGTMAVVLQKTSDGDSKADSSSSSVASETSSKSEKVSVLKSEQSDIRSIKVKNTHGEFTLEKPESGKETWLIDKLTSIDISDTMITSLLSNSADLEAKKLVEENVTDLSKYGLDKPTAEATITYKDGKSVTVQVGDPAPDDKYSYAKLKGEKSVYMIYTTKLNYYTEPVTAYVATTIIEKPSDDEWPEYGVETITRKDLDYKMVFQNDTKNKGGMVSAQVMSEPIYSYLNVTNSSSVTHGMWGLSASECVVVKPQKKDFEKYGISDPLCTVNLKGDKYNYTLKVGDPVYAEKDDSSSAVETDSSSTDSSGIIGYYCYVTGVNGKDCIYVISADSLPWVTMKPSDVITTLMTANYIVDTEDLTIEYNGKTYKYDITSNGTSDESQTDSGDKVDVTKVTIDGKELSVDKFKSFFQYVLTCPTTEVYFKDPTTEKYMTITFKEKDGSGDVLEFYKESARRSVIKLNGKTSFRINNTWVDTLVKNINNLQNDKDIDDNY